MSYKTFGLFALKKGPKTASKAKIATGCKPMQKTDHLLLISYSSPSHPLFNF